MTGFYLIFQIKPLYETEILEWEKILSGNFAQCCKAILFLKSLKYDDANHIQNFIKYFQYSIT